ncbi:hypothetical protein VCHA40P240_60220 [Vibrio chagasii]|nr:hypothetical protein VCHA40P240_60220 [Vibrio chagasii]
MESVKDRYSIDNTDYTVGQDNVQKWGFDVHNPVFGISAGSIIIFLLALLVAEPETAKSALDGIKWKVIGNFDGFFMWAATSLLFSVLPSLSPRMARYVLVAMMPKQSTLTFLGCRCYSLQEWVLV